ncbi:facilitated trehalose transporter Tret1 [Leptinotarsa decemlineata]|uniref:facilitated trehalose transporter Tret1 n=1 Tax=Leptinotarsa decemlineata TaxID=7539 RepID=UPI000C2540E1|nr:facilitated trehalose transporter Tret1-like [Leptinotarsa decemlineata]
MTPDHRNELPLVEEDEELKESREWPQILAILIGSLTSLTVGIFQAWPSPYLLKLSKDKENYNISENEASYLPMINPIASVIFSPFASILCDAIGRKKVLLLTAFPHALAWILNASTNKVYLFYLARCLIGMSECMIYLAMPMYIGEISTPKVRGTFGNTLTFSIFFGSLLMTVLGSYVSVKESSYICVTLPIIFFFSFLFMPESPYYYLMKHRYEDAKVSLRTLSGKKNVDRHFVTLKALVRRQMSESGTWTDLFTVHSNRRALISCTYLRVSQVLGGFMVFFNFTQYIFEKSGNSGVSPQVSSIIFMSLCVFFNFCASLTVDRLGRRLSFMASVGACAIVLFLESLYFYLDKEVTGVDVNSIKWFPLVGLLLYIIFSSFGIAVVPTLLLGELFSTSIKAKGLTMMMMISAASMFSGNYIFYTMSSAFGLYAPLLFFFCINSVSFVFSFYLIPETKGKTLEEIQQSMKKKKNGTVKENLNLLGVSPTLVLSNSTFKS